MFKNTGRQIMFSALVVMVVAAACYPFSGYIGYRSVALLLLLVVSVLAMRLELPAVLTAAVISALVWDFFFIPPHFTLTIGNGEDGLLIMMYFIVATLNGVINYRLRQMAHLKREKEERERSIKLYNALFNALSHDLRTPIAAVLGAADTLIESAAQLSEQQRSALLEEVSAGALRLNSQIENLLNMSRLETGVIKARQEWCDISDLIYGQVKKLPSGEGFRPVTVDISPDFPLVQLDFGLTEQVLENLLANARRHTPTGTWIRITARLAADTVGHFVLDNENNDIKTIRDHVDHRLFLEVSDGGPGIPADELHQVFDKFYRSGSTKSDGTGLGLFVVKGFTEAQGGEVTVRNLPDAGACFTLNMPTKIMNQTIHRHE